MKTFTVEVVRTVEVTLDETKFNTEFFQGFNASIFDFGDCLDEHAAHLGQMFARGIYTNCSEFIEGYGEPRDMGIKYEEISNDSEVTNSRPKGEDDAS